MPDKIRYLYQGGCGEITEKKSRFIATLAPVRTEDEAQAFIDRMKKQYWDARRNCSALVIGERRELTRCSDDGEPPHTAGRPMLDVLLGEGLTNVCAVVTRYFGGTLLGTGGLIRAYQAAVKEGLAACRIVERETAVSVTVQTDYAGVGKLLYLTAAEDLPVPETDYGAQVTARVLVPPEALSGFRKKLLEATAGQARLTCGDPVVFVRLENGVRIL